MLSRNTAMQHLLLAAVLLTSYAAPNPPLSRHDLAVAGDSRAALVAWTQIDNSSARIHVSPLDHWRDVVMPMRGQQQIAPAVAFDGTNFLVVWQEFDIGRVTTFAERVTPAGTLLDANPISLGASTPTLLPRVAWTSGLYRISIGAAVTAINAHGVVAPLFVPVPTSVVDVALTGETTVFARAIPQVCSGFSMFFCTPAKNLLTYQPGGGDVTLTTKPLWIEAEDGTVLWSDGSGFNVTRGGVTRSLLVRANNATVAGSLVVYERDERLYELNLDTNAETPLADGAISPALLVRGDGRITLVYRTTSRPASLKTLELGVEPPARRRTF